MARILVVGRNEGSLAASEALRRLTAHSIENVDSGPAMLDRVRKADFDLVLLDVEMPGMEGFEAFLRLRADKHTRRLPVLFVTDSPDQVESRAKALEVGANDFIVQPISGQALLARIESALRVNALADVIREPNTELETKVRQRTVDFQKLANQLLAERDLVQSTLDEHVASRLRPKS